MEKHLSHSLARLLVPVLIGLIPVHLVGQQPDAPPQQLEGHEAAINAAVYTPDGKHVATASSDQTLRLWNAKDGSIVRTFEGHTGQVLSVAASPDGRSIVAVTEDSLFMWRAPLLEDIQKPESQSSP